MIEQAGPNFLLASSGFRWLEEKRSTLVESRRVAEDGTGKQLAWTREGAASVDEDGVFAAAAAPLDFTRPNGDRSSETEQKASVVA